MKSSEMLCHVAIVRSDVSKDCVASIIRVERMFLRIMLHLVVTANVIPNSLILQNVSYFTHGATSQKMAFFIVTAMKPSNLTYYYGFCVLPNNCLFFIVCNR
jgi:hypothetical protein